MINRFEKDWIAVLRRLRIQIVILKRIEREEKLKKLLMISFKLFFDVCDSLEKSLKYILYQFIF